MKYTLLYIIAAVFCLCSCSKDDADNRLTQIDAPMTDRCVLIEDFTGQKCVNCPTGTEVISDMIKTYGEDHVVAVAIHSGPFGVDKTTKAYPIALKTEFTQQYWDKWFDETQGQPVAKINRGEKTEDYGGWMGLVRTEIAKEPSIHISVSCSYDASSRNVNIATSMKSEGPTSMKLQLWLVEDSITATQKMPDGSTNLEYVHNHVLRAAVNGAWGEDITFSNKVCDRIYDYTLPEEYNAENCSIVGFVYNDEDGVLQATKCEVRVKNQQ